MRIIALHTNGYLYPYDSKDSNDIELWFEGRGIDDIMMAFNADARDSGSDYPSVGMKIGLEYADGIMDGSLDIIKNIRK